MLSLHSLRRRWPWWLAGLLLLIGVIWVDRVLTSPAVGHSETPRLSLASPRPSASPLPPATMASNPYYELDLPPGYTPQPPTQPAGLLLAQTILKPGASGSLIINIGVSQLPAGGLSANSSYSLRAGQPGVYGLSQQNGVPVFTRLDGTNGEVVAFWAHGGRLATISVTDGVGNASGGDTAGDRGTLNSLLQLWQWR